jgi:hypothetical protein
VRTIIKVDEGCLNGLLTTRFIVLDHDCWSFGERVSQVDAALASIRDSEDAECLRVFGQEFCPAVVPDECETLVAAKIR